MDIKERFDLRRTDPEAHARFTAADKVKSDRVWNTLLTADQFRRGSFSLATMAFGAVCKIPERQKGPRTPGWNLTENAISDPAVAAQCEGLGLLHRWAGTMALDLDDLAAARAWFAARGIDLDALLNAPDAIKIGNGRPNRTKLLFRIPFGVDPATLVTKKIVENGKTIFELRCADSKGNSVQDVLPGSTHPDTGQPYRWERNVDLPTLADFLAWLDNMPDLPEPLLVIWRQLMRGEREVTAKREAPPVAPEARVAAPATAPTRDLSAAHAIIAQTDPECDYDTWKNLGMALEHDLGEEGYELWREWSSRYSAYVGDDALAAKWASFGQNKHVTPITLGTFKQKLVASKDMFDVLPDDADVFDETASTKREEAEKLWTVEEIQQLPPMTWLVPGWVPAAPLAAMIGDGAAGKTAVALDWAADLAARGIAPLWLAAEAFSDLNERTRAIEARRGIKFGDLGFRAVCDFELTDARVRKVVAAATAERLNFGVCVLDTYAAASSGSENDAAEVESLRLKPLRKLATALNCTVIVLHHVGKNGEIRGSTALRDALWAVVRVDHDAQTSKRTLSSNKLRNGVARAPQEFRLVEQKFLYDDGREGSGVVVEWGGTTTQAKTRSANMGATIKYGSREQRVIDVLTKHSPLADVDVSNIVVEQQYPGDSNKRKRQQQAAKVAESFARPLKYGAIERRADGLLQIAGFDEELTEGVGDE